MKRKQILSISMIACLTVTVAAHAQNLKLNLSNEAPLCRMSLIKRPALTAERGKESREAIRTHWYEPLVADFNGDGWCDFAWAIPYPLNSQMASYWLEDMLMLATRTRWNSPLRGKKSWSEEISALEPTIWPTYQVDLTNVSLVYGKSGGAPYVLGLKSGNDLGEELVKLGCAEYSSVYRWDTEVDAFKKADDATRDTVIAFYYSTVGQRCDRSRK